jgi:hypothetical protein
MKNFESLYNYIIMKRLPSCISVCLRKNLRHACCKIGHEKTESPSSNSARDSGFRYLSAFAAAPAAGEVVVQYVLEYVVDVAVEEVVLVATATHVGQTCQKEHVNPLSPELNPICYWLALLAYDFLHVSRIRVKSLTLRLLVSYIYIYGAPIPDVSRSHTRTQHSR